MGRGSAVAQFTHERPTPASHWRALILFGRNVASYKFALGASLLEFGAEGRERVSLEELAVPFSRHLCDHLHSADKQATSASSRFLDGCRAFNAGNLTQEGLIDLTARIGFNNVIDAFHVLDGSDVEERFFLDERSTGGGIRLTDRVLDLASTVEAPSLTTEVQARWHLVETAWELNLPRSLLTVSYDADAQVLRAEGRRRQAITGARGALNGYQKGACFYCFGPISITSGAVDLGEVDHVFAWSAGERVGDAPVDGVWNLVLACHGCNNWHGKSNRPPHVRYVERLHRRNEFLIASAHPLRPTLIAQTGESESERVATLRRALSDVSAGGTFTGWEAPFEGEALF